VGVFVFVVSRGGVCIGDHRWLSLSSLCGGSLAREFLHSSSRAEVFALVVWRWSLDLQGFTLNLREVHALCGGVLVSGFWHNGSPEKMAYLVESEGVWGWSAQQEDVQGIHKVVGRLSGEIRVSHRQRRCTRRAMIKTGTVNMTRFTSQRKLAEGASECQGRCKGPGPGLRGSSRWTLRSQG
jgi:hypothetical protein